MSKLPKRVKVAMGIRRNFSRGGNVDILLIFFRSLMLQCKWTFTKCFNLSSPQTNCLQRHMLQSHYFEKNFLKWSCTRVVINYSFHGIGT